MRRLPAEFRLCAVLLHLSCDATRDAATPLPPLNGTPPYSRYEVKFCFSSILSFIFSLNFSLVVARYFSSNLCLLYRNMLQAPDV
uniref:Uncharacterized protein n=1 Tax=Arundo donax TaxID=35708 RepID=A0A0A9EP66_ARUDO